MTSRLRLNRHNHHQTITRHTSATAAKSTQVQSGLQSAGWWPAVAGFCATIISMQMQDLGFLRTPPPSVNINIVAFTVPKQNPEVSLLVELVRLKKACLRHFLVHVIFLVYEVLMM